MYKYMEIGLTSREQHWTQLRKRWWLSWLCYQVLSASQHTHSLPLRPPGWITQQTTGPSVWREGQCQIKRTTPIITINHLLFL